MIKLNILIACLFIVIGVAGQDVKNRNFNFIIMVDDEVWITYTNLKIKIKDKTGSNNVINALYYPGNLSFEREDYDKILDASGDSTTLLIEYKEYGKKTRNYLFELPFSSKWLDNYFMVMRVYNLDKKKYRKVFEPLDKARNYTYELDYPGGQMLRIKKGDQKGKK